MCISSNRNDSSSLNSSRIFWYPQIFAIIEPKRSVAWSEIYDCQKESTKYMEEYFFESFNNINLTNELHSLSSKKKRLLFECAIQTFWLILFHCSLSYARYTFFLIILQVQTTSLSLFGSGLNIWAHPTYHVTAIIMRWHKL